MSCLPRKRDELYNDSGGILTRERARREIGGTRKFHDPKAPLASLGQPRQNAVRMSESPPVSLAVIADAEGLADRAADLARRLGLPLVPAPGVAYDLILAVTSARLELRSTGHGGPGAVYVDFVGGQFGHARRAGGSRLLYSAIGLRGGGLPTVIDATAGLGEDAFLLAMRGCHVTTIERSPVVAALLEDGLARAAAVPELREAVARMRPVSGDAREILRDLSPEQAPDVIYLDPMFPPKKKSALVKKEMRILRRVVGDDPDSGELFEVARKVARRHVVVKRMRLAPTLAPDPTRSYEGKSTRYDVYASRGGRHFRTATVRERTS